MTRWTGRPPNVLADIIGWLKAELPADQFVVRNTVLPDDWNGGGTKVTVVVDRTPGGGPSREGETAASIDISLYADTFDRLHAVGIPAVEKAMAEVPASLYDEVGYDNTFGSIPYANTKVRRADGTYSIGTRFR